MFLSMGKWGNGVFSRVDLVKTQQNEDSGLLKGFMDCFLGVFS